MSENFIIHKVIDENAVIDFLEKFKKSARKIALDIETDSLDFLTGNILSIQVAILLDGKIETFVFLPESRDYWPHVWMILAKFAETIIGHNLKFDLKFLIKNFSEMPLGFLFDTMLAHRLTCVGKDDCDTMVSLEYLLDEYLNIKLDKSIRKEFENHSGSFTVEQINYAAQDVMHLFTLSEILSDKLYEIGHWKIFELESKVLLVVTYMELFGIKLDVEKFRALSLSYLEKANKVRDEIVNFVVERLKEKFSGKTLLDIFDYLAIPVKTKKLRNALSVLEFPKGTDVLVEYLNLNSNKQVLFILNKLLGAEVQNTNAKTLDKYIREKNEDENVEYFINKLLEMREYFKRYTTYGEKFIKKYLKSDGKIHAEFHQLGTTTGRFSSSNPNMQNIPREKEYRHCFIAENGYKIITADYSQMELRLMAAVSKEKKLIEAYRENPNADLHALTASLVFDKPIEEVGKGTEERQIAKSVNFAVIYGATAKGLAYNLDLPIKKAEFILDKFFESYPYLAKFMKSVREIVWKKKYSITPYGRKRFFTVPKVFKSSKDRDRIKAKITREGLNHIIQGGSADVVKLAMVRMFEENPFGIDKFRILLQVHDEVVVEVHESIVEEAKDFIEKVMDEEFQKLLGEVPAVVGIEVSDTWEK